MKKLNLDNVLSFDDYENIFYTKLEKLHDDLEKAQVDGELYELLVFYFTQYMEANPNYVRLYMLILMQAISDATHSETTRSVELNVLRSLIIYDFNHMSIIEYYLRKVEACLDKAPEAEPHIIQEILAISQHSSIYSYDPERKSLGKHISKYLLRRLSILELKALGVFPLTYNSIVVQLKKPPGVFMSLLRLAIETRIIKRSRPSKELFKILSEFVRGPGSRKYAPNTLSNAYLYNDEETLEEVIELLDDMKERAYEAIEEIQSRLGHVE